MCCSIGADDASAFEVKAEADLLQPLFSHGMSQSRLIPRVEHQTATAACADQLSACGPIRQGQIVPLIDFSVTHARATALLLLPMRIHDAAEFRNIAFRQSALSPNRELLHEMEIIRHRG